MVGSPVPGDPNSGSFITHYLPNYTRPRFKILHISVKKKSVSQIFKYRNFSYLKMGNTDILNPDTEKFGKKQLTLPKGKLFIRSGN